MKSLAKIIKKGLFLNKERSITTISSIVLSVFAFTVISLMYFSGLNAIKNVVKEERGDYIIYIQNVDVNSFNKIKDNNEDFTDIRKLSYLGISKDLFKVGNIKYRVFEYGIDLTKEKNIIKL